MTRCGEKLGGFSSDKTQDTILLQTLKAIIDVLSRLEGDGFSDHYLAKDTVDDRVWLYKTKPTRLNLGLDKIFWYSTESKEYDSKGLPTVILLTADHYIEWNEVFRESFKYATVNKDVFKDYDYDEPIKVTELRTILVAATFTVRAGGSLPITDFIKSYRCEPTAFIAERKPCESTEAVESLTKDHPLATETLATIKQLNNLNKYMATPEFYKEPRAIKDLLYAEQRALSLLLEVRGKRLEFLNIVLDPDKF